MTAAQTTGHEVRALDRLELVLFAVVLGVALFIAGFTVGSARGGRPDDPVARRTQLPDWFLPIADAYDRDPDVTPAFDFASLYDARPESYSLRVGVARRPDVP